MNLLPKTTWFSRFVTFGLAIVAGASAGYWMLQWSGANGLSPFAASDAQALVTADVTSVARALGGAGAVTAAAADDTGASLAANRFSLVGVLAVGNTAGAALISVDGARARPFQVGSKVGDVWVLHSVKQRQVVLVQPGSTDGKATTGDAGLVLQMPPLPEIKKAASPGGA